MTVSTYNQTEESVLDIGQGAEVFTGSTIDCSKQVTIGRNVGVGGRALLFTHGGWEIGGHATKYGPITIRDNAWLAWSVTVLPGVTIGEGSVVGACSVVTKDVPDYGIVSGNPAVFKRMRKESEVLPDFREAWSSAMARGSAATDNA